MKKITDEPQELEDSVEIELQEKLTTFNRQQINSFINFYNTYGHSIYQLDSGLRPDLAVACGIMGTQDSDLVCDSLNEVDHIRGQFQLLVDKNMDMLTKHINIAVRTPSSSMITLMRLLLQDGKEDKPVRRQAK